MSNNNQLYLTVTHVARNPSVNRHNRSGGGLITIYPHPGEPPGVNVTQVQTGQQIDLPSVQSPIDSGNIPGYTGPHYTFHFAFWAITGCKDSPLFIPYNTGPGFTVGQNNVVATAYYGAYGDGNGGSGIYLDAFAEDLNSFIDDDFMKVRPIPDNPASEAALSQINKMNYNEQPPSDAANDGFLPTDGSWPKNILQLCTITADAKTHQGLEFVQWLVPEELISHQSVNVDPSDPSTLDVGPSSGAWAFGIYKKPTGQVIICPANLSGLICKYSIKCPANLVAPICKSSIHGCQAPVGCLGPIDIGGKTCLAIDPADRWRQNLTEDILKDICKESGVKDIKELSAKLNTARVKKVIAKLSPANRKALTLMLKQIREE